MVAESLRILLATSCHGYKDEQLAVLVAAAVYDIAAVREAAAAWTSWCDGTLTETGPSTWDDERLAHRFGLGVLPRYAEDQKDYKT